MLNSNYPNCDIKPLAFALDEAFAHNPHTGETMGATDIVASIITDSYTVDCW